MGNIKINKDRVNELGGTAAKGSTQAGDASNLASNGFSGLETVFGSGGAQIGQQLGMIGDSLGNVQGIMQRQVDSMFAMDEALAKMADDIEVPQDFVRNEANRFTTYHNEMLEKLDGKSVNDGGDTRDTKDIDGSAIDKEKEMGKLDTENGAEQQEYDDGSGIGKEQEMANITTAGGTENQDYDSRSVVDDQESLRKLDTTNGVEQQEYDPNSLINGEQRLENIQGAGGLAQQEVNTDSVINGQEELGQLDKENGLTRQEIIERSRLNAQEALDKMSEAGDKLKKDGANANKAMQDKNVLDMLREDFTENGTSEPVAKRLDTTNIASAVVVPQMETVVETETK